LVLTQIISGMTRGSVFFLLASGLTLIFGVNKVINFTHGALYLLGMYISFSLVTKIFEALPFAFWLSLILAPMCIAGIAALMEIVFFRRIYGKEHLGLIYFMSDMMKYFWGPIPKTISRPDSLDGHIMLAGILVPTYNLLIIIIGVVVLIGLWVMIQKTGFGRLIRASASDPDMTRALGVKVGTVLTMVFTLAGFLAGFAGALNLPMSAASLGLDVETTILAFIIVVIGGAGSITGTMLASLSVGIVESLGIMLIPRLTIVLVYFVMVVVLLVRPHGILGKVVE
jgi:branched-subunit amino acid ABC-type transport system permease component